MNTHASGMLSYRPDIDGLRAIAILSVVLYHAGVPWVPGGFVGVDIFFVISGYLITGIVMREMAVGHFSLIRFYLRRVSRILPALTVVISATWLLGYLCMLPDEFAHLARQMGYSALFIINLLFKREQADYFHAAAEMQPLLHLWSLSIEEQFYVIWPLLLLLLGRRTTALRAILLLVIAGSFIASCYAVAHANSKAAFYFLTYRSWELAVGAAIAVWRLDIRLTSDTRLGHVVSAAGFALLVAGIGGLDRTSPFPAWSALLPTFGAAAIIIAGPGAWFNRFVLSRRVVVGLGLISYSLYLWHWPLLALTRVVHMGELPTSWAWSAVAIALIASIASWYWIETPVRRWAAEVAGPPSDRGRMLRRLLPLAASLPMIFGVALWTYLAKGFEGRFPSEVLALGKQNRQIDLTGACTLTAQGSSVTLSTDCARILTSKNAPSVIVWGDSLASAVFVGVRQYLSKQGIEPGILKVDGCPPLPGIERVDDDRRCAQESEATLAFLMKVPDIKTVILTGRFVTYSEPGSFGYETAPPPRFISTQSQPSESQRELVLGALKETVSSLRSAGKSVIIINEPPQQLVDETRCHARRSWGNGLNVAIDCDIPFNLHHARSAAVNDALTKLSSAQHRVCYFQPAQYLCNEQKCASEIDGETIYLDNIHLNARGAEYLALHLDFDRCLPAH